MKPAALRLLRSSLALPCWQVRWDHQVGLDLNLGAPSMEVVEPHISTAKSPRVRAMHARRRIWLRGTHWLWVAPEVWRMALADGTKARRKSSARQCNIAAARLTGERLTGLDIDPRTGTTTFYFDLGATISAVRPRGWGHPEDGELWSLHGPRQRYVAVFASGRYAFGIATRPDREPVSIHDGSSEVEHLCVGRIPT